MATETKFISEYGFNTPNIVVVGSDQDATTTLNGSISTNGGISAVKSIVAGGYITALGFKLQSGTSTQFLKANGTVDSTTYQTANTNLSNISGLTGEGVLRRNANNTWYLDTTTYSTSNGTVTSVSGTGSVSGISLSGTVTSTGNLILGGALQVLPSNFQPQVQKTFLAAPTSIDGQVSFRTIDVEDIPVLNQNTTGNAATASKLQGSVNINGTAFDGSSNITLSSSLVTENTTLNASVYPVWASTAPTGLKSLNNSSTKFYFNPSTGIVTASSFKTPTGLSTQFLKADGSLDSNSYSLFGHDHNTTYQPLDSDLTSIAAVTGSGLLKRNSNDTWSLDTNTYATTTLISSLASNTLPLDHGKPTIGTSTKYSREDHKHKPTPTNYNPKIGLLDEDTMPVYGKFEMSYVSTILYPWIVTTDSDDQEILYFRASDGTTYDRGGIAADEYYFQAKRTDSNSQWIFGNEIIHPPFLSPTTYIDYMCCAGFEYAIFLDSLDICHLVKHNGDHNTSNWTSSVIIQLGASKPFNSMAYDPKTDTIIVLKNSSNNIYLSTFDGTTGLQRGTSQIFYNQVTDFDYTPPTGWTAGNKSDRGISVFYGNNKLYITHGILCYYTTDAGSTSYLDKRLTISYNVTDAELLSGFTAPLTPNIPYNNYGIFSGANVNLYNGCTTSSYSYNTRSLKFNAAFRRQQAKSADILLFDTIPSSSSLPYTGALYFQVVTTPSSCSWSKGISQNFLCLNNRLYFSSIGDSVSGVGSNTTNYTSSFEFSNTLVNIDQFNPIPRTNWKSTEVESQILADVYSTIMTSQTTTTITYVLYDTVNAPVSRVDTSTQTVGGITYTNVRSLTSLSLNTPSLPTGWINYSTTYDSVRNVFWCKAIRATNPDPLKQGFLELLKYSSGSWRIVSDFFTTSARTIWDSLAVWSRSVRGQAYPHQNPSSILVDTLGRYYTTLRYAGVGGASSSNLLRINDSDPNNVTIEQSNFPSVNPYTGVTGLGYSSTLGYYFSCASSEFNMGILYTSRNPDTEVSYTLDEWFTGANRHTLKVMPRGSVGLSASIVSYPITLGGYYSYSGNIEVALNSNTDNYIFLSRDKIDPQKINVTVESTYQAPGFNRICIARLTTNEDSIIDQELYKLQYNQETLSTNNISLRSAEYSTSSATINTLSTIDAFDITKFRSAEYLVTCNSGTSFSMNKLLVLHDGATAYITEYGSIFNNVNLVSFDVDIVSGQLNLKATPVNNNTNIKIVRTLVNI